LNDVTIRKEEESNPQLLKQFYTFPQEDDKKLLWGELLIRKTVDVKKNFIWEKH
jgi:hypothetical protein